VIRFGVHISHYVGVHIGCWIIGVVFIGISSHIGVWTSRGSSHMRTGRGRNGAELASEELEGDELDSELGGDGGLCCFILTW